VSYLIHYVVGMLEETEDAVVQLDAHIISIFFKTEGTKIKVFKPVIAQLPGTGCLS